MHQAAQLREVADALEPFEDWIESSQHISISLHDDAEHDVDIHGTQPAMLESVERDHDAETVSQDADGLVRYITVKTGVLDLTWHRR